MQYNPHNSQETKGKYQEVPLLDLRRQYDYLSKEIERVIIHALSNAHYILGPEVKELEDQIANYLDAKHCIGVASGTDALVISLRAMAIKTKGAEYFSPEDEIITTPFTFTATGGSILRAGAIPVFVDIDPKTYNINPAAFKQAISPRTVGILPVHLYGKPCQMDEIMQVAKEHSLFVLEDVAQAFGAKWQNKKLGSIGDMAAFSFFPSKNLGCFGDGGMIATNNDDLAQTAKMLRTHGGKDKYNVEYIGYNSRLDTIQASILLVKLKHVDRLNKLRRKIASIYNEHFKDIDWLTIPGEIAGGEHVYHQYTLRIGKGNRDVVKAELNNKGIATAVYYPVSLHKMKVFEDRCKKTGPLIQTQKACDEVLSLPMDPLLKEEELQYIIDSIRKISL